MPRTVIRTALAAALLACAAPSPARAQQAAPPLSALRLDAPAPAPAPAHLVPALQDARRPASNGELALAGVAAGALGLLGGGTLGYALETGLSDCQGEEFCGAGGIILGALAGELLMVPYGVHLANGRRGSYVVDLGASVLVGLGALGLAAGLAEAAPAVAVAVPAAQLVAVVSAERKSAARKARVD